MKTLACAMILSIFLGQGSALAHSDHGVISGQTALSIASKSVKKLAFKDFGFEVGKLDASWKELKDSHFSVIEVLEGSYIVSAKNSASAKAIYFRIGKNGQVLSVKNKNEF
ncbi:MAG: putative cupredoxin-like copper-binding protein [Paraglaciecola sp.]|jgi:uncharacterized cupredoxin-like copper-binding protein